MPKQCRQSTEWSDLAKLRSPSRLKNVLDRAQRRWNGGYKTYHIFQQNLENILVGLPVELILLIADLLSKSEQLLLSLSSKRIHVILTGHYNLSLHNLEQKLDFALILEREFPDYLTCRSCALMYKWKLQASKNYRCPRRYVKPYDKLHHSLSAICCNQSPHLGIGREVFDLISRAHCRGLDHGISLAQIGHDCSGKDVLDGFWTQEHLEGRIIDDKFFIARSCTFTEHLSNFQKESYRGFILPVCQHQYWTLTWEKLSRERNWNRQQLLNSATMRCGFCQTDYRSTLLPCGDGDLLRAEVYVWQSYGRCQPEQRETPAMFVLNYTRNPTDEILVASRDLERDFVVVKEPQRNHHD